MSTADRVGRLREKLRTEGCDAVLITQSDNRRYVTGFTGTAGAVLITASAARLLTDFRYIEQATQQAPEFEVVKIQKMHEGVAEQAEELGLSSLAFESEDMTVKQHTELSEALSEADSQVELQPVTDWVEASRASKDDNEIAALRRVVLIGDRTMEDVALKMRPGMTEREVAWQLEVGMRERGADGLSFDIIVAAGPNGAMPHHHPTDRPLQAGEPIVIDMGARLDGYCSDLTRTFVLGEPDERFWEVYTTVLRAQQTCEMSLKAGLNGVEADELAREVIEAAGYGDQFGHGTGHGVGLAIHEAPRLSPIASDDPFPEGCVVTVEPGIYLPDWGGVRIEDMVVVGADGIEVLTSAHKQPTVPLPPP